MLQSNRGAVLLRGKTAVRACAAAKNRVVFSSKELHFAGKSPPCRKSGRLLDIVAFGRCNGFADVGKLNKPLGSPTSAPPFYRLTALTDNCLDKRLRAFPPAPPASIKKLTGDSREPYYTLCRKTKSKGKAKKL